MAEVASARAASEPGSTTSATRRSWSTPASDLGVGLADVGVAAASVAAFASLELGVQAHLVLAQTRDLVAQGVADLALERARTEHDPHGERQEDRDDGDEVVAEVDHQKTPWMDDHRSSMRAPSTWSEGAAPVGGPQRGAECEQPDARA